MSYRLDLALDPPGLALRATAEEQLDDAIRQLREERADDPVVAVHEARKDLKKVRSLLRLARTGMKGEARRAANDVLRDIAAELADTRDADVMIETLAGLRERFAGQVPARMFSIVQRRFASAAARSRMRADHAISEDLLARLAAERGAVAGWPLGEVDLGAGMAIAYARGRAEHRAARKDPSVEQLHEWRKRVKDLWYHARLLEEAWPAVFAALAEEAHTLSDLLGDDHDLGVLAERLPDHVWPPSVDAPTLVDLCHQRRAELEADAFALGAKLYAEKPGAFARRVQVYL